MRRGVRRRSQGMVWHMSGELVVEAPGYSAEAYAKIVTWAAEQMVYAVLGSPKRRRRALARVGTKGRRGAIRVGHLG